MLCLVDGDILLYRSGFAAQRNVHILKDMNDNEVFRTTSKSELDVFLHGQDPDEYVLESEFTVDPLPFAKSNLRNSLDKIFANTDADEYEIFLTGDNNFRDEIATIKPYKGNRDRDAKPAYYNELKQFIIKSYGAVVIEGQEADDQLSIEQWKDFKKNKTKKKCGTVIATIDKDLDIVPGWHYNFKDEVMYWVTPKQAIRSFYIQLLTGDATDNIQGLENCSESIRKKYGIRKSKGCGQVAAEKILEGCETEKDMLARCYEAYFEWEVELRAIDNPSATTLLSCDNYAEGKLIENGRLLWMRTKPNEMWSPKL